jgi:hypothetical protein
VLKSQRQVASEIKDGFTIQDSSFFFLLLSSPPLLLFFLLFRSVFSIYFLYLRL